MFIHVDPDSRLGKVITVAGLPLFAALLLYQLADFGRAFRSCRWPAAAGVIVESVSCLEQGGLGWEDGFMLLVGTAGIILGARDLCQAIRWLAPWR
ncbi:MAG: hypothetical protein L0211_18760 [Planctomycetaceae bacterium]|nr:hypothetical protein [Planctomycetaceae bacterium]